MKKFETLVRTARNTPLTRPAVAELANKAPPKDLADAALEALDAAGAPAAMVLAYAAAAAGGTLDRALTKGLLPEVLSLEHLGPLVCATEGGPLPVLTEFLAEKHGDLELDCLALLFAADCLEEDSKPPPELLIRGRWLARHALGAEASVFFGAAVMLLGDPALTSLGSKHVSRAKKAKKAIEDILETLDLEPLEVLSDVDGARISAGFTVKHDTPSVGRNDPCPCGSGKKYKKCHAGGEAASPSSEPAKLDARAISAEQAALLRPSEIATLETLHLSTKAFTEAFHRALDFKHWDLCFRMLEEARARKDIADAIDILALGALHAAYEGKALEAAERLHRMLPKDMADLEAFGIECLRAHPDMLARIECEAERALRDPPDGPHAIMLALALLRHYPALGIFVGRGALNEYRTRDSEALLETIEDARDRLLLSPHEHWWDVFDALFEQEDARREQKKVDAKREKMKADLKNARAASRKSALEMEKLEKRIAELDVSLLPAKKSSPDVASTGAATPSPELTEERKRLKSKIDELQRIIGEGQEERRELRRQIADQEATDRPRDSEEERESEDEDDDDEGENAADAPRNILVPRYSERAAKAVTELANDAADIALTVVASLAAGKPNAWSGVKQLTKARGVLSARAGIHHRVLFAVRDRSLEVLEVIHRRELEQVVTRLAKST